VVSDLYSDSAMTSTRRSRVLALLACTAILTTAVAYALLLQQQASGLGEPPTSAWEGLRGAPTWVLATLAATIATTASATWLQPSRGRRRLLLATAAVLFAVGFVAAFSIGVGLILAGALSVGAATTDKTARATAPPISPLPRSV
jgi:MFS family permease